MRIALLTTNLQPTNGWASVAVGRGAALMELGVEVVALTAQDDAPPVGITPTEIRPVLPRIHGRGRAALPLLASNPAILRATSDCDLVDAVAEPYALACLLTSQVRPLVVTAHGTYVPRMIARGRARGLYRWIYRRAHIQAVSEYTARRISLALGIQAPEVVLSGVDYEFYWAARPLPEKRGPTVLSVGALKKRKGAHILVDAMAHVREQMPDVQCVFIGTATNRRYVPKLKRKIGALGLDDCVHLMGHLPYEKVVGWYQAADVFALPSLNSRMMFEGFGLVFLEANACGLPVIGTRDNGAESAIVDGETGFLIPQNDPQELAARIIEILRDRALRARLSRAALAFAQAHTWHISATHALRFYEHVLAQHRR